MAVRVVGIRPEEEGLVSKVLAHMEPLEDQPADPFEIEADFVPEDMPRVVISRWIARRLGKEVGDRFSLMTFDEEIEDNRTRYRANDRWVLVSRIYSSGNSEFDKLHIYVDGRPGSTGKVFFGSPDAQIAELRVKQREVFGPVLHVVRFRGGELARVVEEINATGYGLTFGIHSRLDSTIDFLSGRVRAGNVYVNRNIVGAVVGVQPFGGEGLSGTGPKAGGPLYLHALVAARDVAPEALAASRVASAADEPSPLDELSEWAQATGRTVLAAHCRAYARLTLAGHRIDLPGPTGEANSLAFVPRGAVGCIAESAELLLEQFAAALATGNDAGHAAAEKHTVACRAVSRPWMLPATS